jgi:hypothetical protein
MPAARVAKIHALLCAHAPMFVTATTGIDKKNLGHVV